MAFWKLQYSVQIQESRQHKLSWTKAASETAWILTVKRTNLMPTQLQIKIQLSRTIMVTGDHQDSCYPWGIFSLQSKPHSLGWTTTTKKRLLSGQLEPLLCFPVNYSLNRGHLLYPEHPLEGPHWPPNWQTCFRFLSSLTFLRQFKWLNTASFDALLLGLQPPCVRPFLLSLWLLE